MKRQLICSLFIALLCLPAGENLRAQEISGAGHTDGGRGTCAEIRNHACYEVLEGDSLGKILRERLGLADKIIFSPRTAALLRQANTGLHDLNSLRAGDRLLVPASLLRQQSPGSGKTALAQQRKEPAGADPVFGDAQKAPQQPAPQASSAASPDCPIKKRSIEPRNSRAREEKIHRLMASFTRAFGGLKNTTCEQTLAVDAAGIFTLECSKFPRYEFPWGDKILLDIGSTLPPSVHKIIAAAGRPTTVLSVHGSEPVAVVMNKIIEGCGLQRIDQGNRFMLRRNNMQITVNGDWIVVNETEPGKIFIISLDGGSTLPEPLKLYLSLLGINFIFLAEHSPAAADCPHADFSPANQLTDNLTDPASLADAVLELAGISFQQNSKARLISRQESGIALEVSCDRKFLLAGRPCCILFKKISVNLASMFRDQGYSILQIDTTKQPGLAEVQSLLNFCGLKNTRPTVHVQYDHSNKTSIKFSFPGFLLRTKKGGFLLADTVIDHEILNFISSLNIKTIYF